jgi:5-methylcytosine-specific restriction protein A
VARQNFSRKVQAEANARAAGKCESCRANLKVGEGEYDHILPDELGGKPTLANCQVLCVPCHKSKTGHDVRRMRKGDRQRDKHTGAIKPKGGMPHVPMPGRQKAERPAGKAPMKPRILYLPTCGLGESGD